MILAAVYLVKHYTTYQLSETHEAVKGSRVAGEVDTLGRGNAKSVRVQSETSNIDIIGNDIASNRTRSVGDLELLASIDERRGRLSSEESVVSLEKTGMGSWNSVNSDELLRSLHRPQIGTVHHRPKDRQIRSP